MTKSNYTMTALGICALLPIAAVAPYLFYSKGFRVISWVWNSGYWLFWLNLVIAMVSSAVCSVLLLQFHAYGRLVYSISATVITAISAFFAMSEHRHSLLVLVFFIAALLLWASELLRRVLDLPFYNSRRHWWEAHPKSIPGIQAKVYAHEGDEKFVEARVSNFGEDGCFLFLLHKSWDFKPAYVELSFQNKHKLASKVSTILFTRDKKGVGLKFERLPRQDDWHRDLQEYLNGLRRSGYVSG